MMDVDLYSGSMYKSESKGLKMNMCCVRGPHSPCVPCILNIDENSID